jgi:type I restriction enzyme, S subunit
VSNKATISHFTKEKFSKSLLVVPPLAEQQAITDYLDCKCAGIDNIINGKQKLIDKLADYKKSFIYECVTGKREVV